MTETKYIFGILLLGLAVAALLVSTVVKRNKCARLYEQAVLAAQNGKTEDLLATLVQAEKLWDFNVGNGNLKSNLQDINLLESIFRKLNSLPLPGPARTACESTLKLVVELNSLFSDRSNFGIDGRSMKPEAARRWASLKPQLDSARAEFRSALPTTTT